MPDKPLAYFITFTTHGTWLHGDPRNSIIRQDGKTKMMGSNPQLYQHEQIRLKHPPVKLDSEHRALIKDAILKLCRLRQWHLFALHVRSNHVHAVIRANCRIDLVMNNFKRWATHRLRENGFSGKKVWTLGGSKKYVFKEEKLREKVHYVIYEQGVMMAYYIDEVFRK